MTPTPTGSHPRLAPSADQFEAARSLAAAAPWIDVHAHPGRCFLGGLPAGDPLAAGLGGDGARAAVAEIAAGGVAAVAFSTVADLRVLQVTDHGLAAGRDFAPGEARHDHDRQIDALAALADDGAVLLVRTASDFDRAHREGRVGMILACEGADFLDGRLDGLADAHRRGARSITLVHYRVNELGDIQTEPERHGGLTPFGAEVVAEMNRLGLLIDLAHATLSTTRDVVERSAHPVVISHSHLARGIDSHPRLLADDHARAVSSRGGVIGAWPAGVAVTDLDGYVGEILRLVEVVGVEHVAIGTDMDANFRPVLTSYGQFLDVAARLLARGLDQSEVVAVMGGNYRRVFAAACG